MDVKISLHIKNYPCLMLVSCHGVVNFTGFEGWIVEQCVKAFNLSYRPNIFLMAKKLDF
jgi:hypothetical protein